ncbi:glycosyltransferase [Rathayibacter rathayi]|uniref:glycosyltransferase n=1 Tax=Rathayibacter rathayi TaxID=33887 RepID=UPI0030B8B37B
MQPEIPTDDLSDLPGVSYVMPVLNDVTHVRAAVDSLLHQDYIGPFDIVLALAPSIDGTEELVAELSTADPRISVVPNEAGSTPAGLNAAIRASRHPVVVLVDAHSVLPPDYSRTAVDVLRRSGAANVGGVMAAEGLTAFQRAVARAYGSRIGLGGTPYQVGGEEGPADTVYLGVFRRSALERVGLFDERFKRGQDWELNRRLREHGDVVWFTPRLSVTYRPPAVDACPAAAVPLDGDVARRTHADVPRVTLAAVRRSAPARDAARGRAPGRAGWSRADTRGSRALASARLRGTGRVSPPGGRRDARDRAAGRCACDAVVRRGHPGGPPGLGDGLRARLRRADQHHFHSPHQPRSDSPRGA